MNGIEKLTARIETDAQAEVAEILRAAEEKARETLRYLSSLMLFTP